MHIFFYKTASGRSPVEKFIEGLPKPDQAKFADVNDGIAEHGLQYEPVEFKHLRGKLWEIKFKAKGGGYQIAYAILDKDTMVWLHAFRKDSQKTPEDDLNLAEMRMKEVLS